MTQRMKIQLFYSLSCYFKFISNEMSSVGKNDNENSIKSLSLEYTVKPNTSHLS